MRSYAVIPPLMLDSKQRRLVFNNENGALIDMETEFKVRSLVVLLHEQMLHQLECN